MRPEEHSFMTPASSSSGPQSARELADDSRAALVDLESLLKQRNRILEQQIQANERELANLMREKGDLEQTLRIEQRNSTDKREQLWNEIDKGRIALEQQTEALKRLERHLREKQRERDAEKQRADRLEQDFKDQEAELAYATRKLATERSESVARQQGLQQCVEKLAKQLQEQSAGFEKERARWQQGTATGGRNVDSGLISSLERAIPHLRSLLNAFDREGGYADANHQPSTASQNEDQAQSTSLGESDLAQRLREQENAFGQERAQLLEQASDAARTQLDISRQSLVEREAVLTCPISFEVFDDPVVTQCCGKTFSSETLRRALRRTSQCPFCRASHVSFSANRDMAKLVELHRGERSILGLPELPAPSPVTPSIDTRPPTSSGRTHRDRTPPTARQSRHREHRSERVHERSGVTHRLSSRPHASSTGNFMWRLRHQRYGSSSYRSRTGRSGESHTLPRAALTISSSGPNSSSPATRSRSSQLLQTDSVTTGAVSGFLRLPLIFMATRNLGSDMISRRGTNVADAGQISSQNIRMARLGAALHSQTNELNRQLENSYASTGAMPRSDSLRLASTQSTPDHRQSGDIRRQQRELVVLDSDSSSSHSSLSSSSSSSSTQSADSF